MIPEFPHKAPKGYSYEFETDFKRNITAIWLRHHYRYDYNLGKLSGVFGDFTTPRKDSTSPQSIQRQWVM